MSDNEDQRCPICGRFGNPRFKNGFVRDHDHVSGQLRGWLCSSCNSGLGLFGDDPTTIRNALRYLEHYKAIDDDAIFEAGPRTYRSQANNDILMAAHRILRMERAYIHTFGEPPEKKPVE